MYNILIVDDEKIEREGIKLLIQENNLPLHIAEAVNGKAALDHIKGNKVDILFTDVKMPFMDGLQLANAAREILPNIKIVIFSAFGEFEYAKQAISIRVLYYILKPIVVEEFTNVMNELLQLCKEEEEQEKNYEMLLEGYNKGLQFEKEKILLDIVNGAEINDILTDRMQSIGLDFVRSNIQIIIFDFRVKFFEQHHIDFLSILKDVCFLDFEYVNLNEFQSMIFLKKVGESPDTEELSKMSKALFAIIDEKYKLQMCIIIGRPINEYVEIYTEYKNMEQLLELTFFLEESVVLFTYESSSKSGLSPEAIEKLLVNIYESIQINDYFSAEKKIQLFFDSLKSSGNNSVVYIKYACTEIIKKILAKPDKIDVVHFNNTLKDVYKCSNLLLLKDLVLSLVAEVKNENLSKNDELNKRIIRNIINIVQQEYMHELSLESISRRVYLSTGYTSALFKREVGQNLVKYITNLRLEKAKELLQNSNLKIGEISMNIGYADPSYFCMIFKKVYGMSPAKFREKEGQYE